MLLQWQLSELVVCVPDTNTHTHLIYIQPNFLKKRYLKKHRIFAQEPGACGGDLHRGLAVLICLIVKLIPKLICHGMEGVSMPIPRRGCAAKARYDPLVSLESQSLLKWENVKFAEKSRGRSVPGSSHSYSSSSPPKGEHGIGMTNKAVTPYPGTVIQHRLHKSIVEHYPCMGCKKFVLNA